MRLGSAPVLGVMLLCSMGCAAWQQPGARIGLVPPGEHGRMVRVPSGRALYSVVHEGPAGGATPVLLVHGFASDHQSWAPIEPALRDGRTTVAVDLPGFGLSERTPGDYAPAAIAEDLASVLDALRIQTVDVVAHSWGSAVTLALALAHPERVRRIVLMGAWVYDEQIPPFFRWAELPGVGEALFSAFYRERAADRMALGFADASRELVTQQLAEAVDVTLERPGTVRAALAAARGQCFLQLERRYGTIRQPTLLIWGSEDGVARPRFGVRLARELRNARLVVLDGVGHFAMWEAAGRTRAEIVAFLGAATP